MTEQTENATRLARQIIRLAKLVGIATSYVGMSRDYHEIEDDVLVAVLKALGIDASNDGAIEQSITTIQRERDTRIVPPTVLHVVGKESKVEVHGGALDVPEASIMLEDGGAYAGKIEHEGGSGAAIEVDGGFVCTSYLVLPEDLPEGYHTLEVTVGGKTESATVISAPEKIELLDEMKKGSLWGWMSQLYSIRSSGSWGIGDYEDLKTLLVESKKKTGADFIAAGRKRRSDRGGYHRFRKNALLSDRHPEKEKSEIRTPVYSARQAGAQSVRCQSIKSADSSFNSRVADRLTVHLRQYDISSNLSSK